MTYGAIVTCIITAIVGGLIGLMFYKVERKIDQVAADNERHHKETIEIRVAERELLLAEARISSLTAKCVRGEYVNGELEKAEEELERTQKNMQGITMRIALGTVEGAK